MCRLFSAVFLLEDLLKSVIFLWSYSPFPTQIRRDRIPSYREGGGGGGGNLQPAVNLRTIYGCPKVACRPIYGAFNNKYRNWQLLRSREAEKMSTASRIQEQTGARVGNTR